MGITGAIYTITPSGVATRYGRLSLQTGTAYGLAYGNGGLLTDLFLNSEVDLYSVAAGGNNIHLVGALQTGAFQVATGSLAFGPGGTLYFEDNPASNTNAINPRCFRSTLPPARASWVSRCSSCRPVRLSEEMFTNGLHSVVLDP